MKQVPQAVQDCHACLLWLIPQLDKFPRNRRFTVGERMESGLLVVLELLIEASYQQRNRQALDQANRKLAVVRHCWRLCFDLKIVAIKQYQYGGELLLSLGKQIGDGANRRQPQQSSKGHGPGEPCFARRLLEQQPGQFAFGEPQQECRL
jgi:hypothetical protein